MFPMAFFSILAVAIWIGVPILVYTVINRWINRFVQVRREQNDLLRQLLLTLDKRLPNTDPHKNPVEEPTDPTS